MTRKQYVKKMRQLQRNLNIYAKEHGMKISKTADRVRTPIWGTEIIIGSHKGEKLLSYAQSWDLISETLKGTPCMEGIQ
jgi:hypothetical protein